MRIGSLEIEQFPCLKDNYGVLLRDEAHNLVAAIDAPSAEDVQAALEAKGWQLTHIFVTHHHWDHTQGIGALAGRYAPTVIGPAAEADRIAGLDRTVGDGDVIMFGSHEIQVLGTPGHTSGHVTYWIPASHVAFCGDTLFAMGCGRVLEGSMDTMFRSVSRLGNLPPDTFVYCGHEYTVANARFALSVEPDNALLRARLEDVSLLRAAGKPTLPTRIETERATNPFLRASSPSIRAALGMANASDQEVFAELRERKNRA